MSHSSSKLRHGSWSGFRKVGDGNRAPSTDRTKRDLGSADDAYGQVAPELEDGVLLAGRYQVLRKLGRGGFSDVYLAHDHELNRAVAIKRLLLSDVDPQFIKDEAKTLASLDHPGIVRIFDICNEPMYGFLVIMQYVPGPMLRDVLTKTLPINRAVEIAIRISGGLIHAHSRGVVHRDIKPTNILMSNEGEPLIADFGLAFTPLAHSEPEGGTPRYMSPEQIRNETKRIGPSSDIFSTGILLYEMLAGRVPFNGATTEAISRATLEQAPTPINEINADVPAELDRIVRRALRKNVKDRYSSMEAFQADLIQWLDNSGTSDEMYTVRISEWERNKALDSTFASSAFNCLGQFTHRGLQPFESDDAKFFLSLVPGARAPSGLPESIQYWKDWIESYDSSEYGRVGILYGPSGSGKTSLLRAGIVPYLAPDLLPIKIECRKGESIAQLTAQIGQQVSHESVELATLLIQLRDSSAARNEHRKVVLILDQFDNWAGSATTAQLIELAAALRHCDGETLQAMLIVRDDFWTSATEFMKLVECGVEQWKNARSIELFDRHHARRLLEAAGRSFGSLPPSPEALNADQSAFIAKAIEEMSIKGRVLPIQLAMFAKIAKLQSWHPDTLTQAGGVHGTYVGYFQDLFEGTTSPPVYQRVCNAVVEVLHRLLPNADQTTHSHQVEFGELEAILIEKNLQNQLHRALNILVEDLRIVVRVSQRGSQSASEYAVRCNDRFHLVHDFLTVPIANWVDQVRKSSWRGRAVARLEELSAMWSRNQHQRFLPTLPEYVAMQIAAPSERRSAVHRRFLRNAGRKHFIRTLVALAFIVPVCIVTVTSVWQHQRNVEEHQKYVVERVESAICAVDIDEFLDLMAHLDDEQGLVAKAARLWEDSLADTQRTRARLLLATIQRTSLEKIASDLGLIEPQLSRYFIAASRENKDGKHTLRAIFKKASSCDAINVETIRAAISLACIGDLEPIMQMLEDSQSPAQINNFFRRALDWDTPPQVWVELATSNLSANATYFALCLLGSYPDSDLPRNIPWNEIAALQNSNDAGVSSTAKWLIEKTPTAKGAIASPNSAGYRVLSCGLEQIRVEAGQSNRSVSSINIELNSNEIKVEKAFWLSCAAVTNAEFNLFLESLESTGQTSFRPIVRSKKRNPELELHSNRSVTGLNPVLAALYCNWLSAREHLTPAYEILPNLDDDDSSRVRIIEDANGFKLPSVSQLAYAADFGLIENTSDQKAHLPVMAFRKSRHEDLSQDEPNRYLITRLSKSLMPNRAGMHFDLDAYDCWAVAESRICSFTSTPTGFIVQAREDKVPSPFVALWVVSECHECVP